MCVNVICEVKVEKSASVNGDRKEKDKSST